MLLINLISGLIARLRIGITMLTKQTKDQKAEMVRQLQDEGLTQKAIAEKTGFALSFVRAEWVSVERANGATGEQIRALQKAGLTQAEAANKLGCSLSKVRTEWVKAKRTGRPSVPVKQINDLIAAGHSDKKIADLLGISVATVNRTRRNIKTA